ncbi:MAG: glycerophosphodiester phosphodiesterase [Bacteroidaceae bacterium]
MKRTFFTTLLASLLAAAPLSLAAQHKVVAHRGFWKAEGSAQNSLTSLRRAAEAGCYGSELDVYRTIDGVLVVNHDNKINDVRVEDTSYPNLQYIRLSNGEYLPTLLQYLQEGARYPQMKLVLEIKSHRNAEREQSVVDDIVKLVHDLGMQEQVEYIAFSRVVCARVHEVDPQAKIAYLNGDLSPKEVKALGWTGIDYEKGVLQRNPDWTREAKELGLEVNVWTLRGEEDIQAHQADPNIDLFTTDDPDVALRLTQPAPEPAKKKSGKSKKKKG